MTHFLNSRAHTDAEENSMNENDPRPQNKTLGRVVSEYQSAYTDPLVIRAGEKLTASDRDSEWAGWVWCTNQMGKSRWVPEKYLARKGNDCTALCDYEATELAVRVGVILELGQEESDWVWCANQSGQSGWVPTEKIQRIFPTTEPDSSGENHDG
jgi:hypothetical protein